MKEQTTPEERDELTAAKLYAALVYFTIFAAGAAIFIYKLIEEVLCNR